MTKFNKGYGLGSPLQGIFPSPIIANRAPLATDHNYRLGQIWLHSGTNIFYGLADVTAGSATWSVMASGTTDLETLTGDSGGAIIPVSSNITLTGGTNITTAGTAGTITANLDDAIALATSVTSPRYLATAGGDMNIIAPTGQDVLIKTGDNAAANKISITDSDDVEVAVLDSDGKLNCLSINATAIGDLTPSTGQFTTISASNTDLVINSAPVMSTKANTGGVPTGATGDENLMVLQGGEILEQHILGAGQTIIAPVMEADGLLISLDLTDDEGAEYSWGVLGNNKHTYTIGTSEAFYCEFQLKLADVTGCDPVYIGFRKQEAYQADYTTYTDFALIGVEETQNSALTTIATNLNAAGATYTNTTDAWADGETHRVGVYVSAAGVVTFTIDGVAPTATATFTFDNGDVVMPCIYGLHGTTTPGKWHLIEAKVGLQ